jgi:peptidoglycan/LPS O-acetylase OafA/YrhL
MPAYYLAVFGSVALLWGAAGTPGVRLPPATSLPLFALFAQNYSSASVLTLDPPTWTLAIEASFYVALPLIGIAAARRWALPPRPDPAPVALILVGLAWNTSTGLAMPLDKLLPAALPYFGVGMLAAVLVHERRLGRRGARCVALSGCAAVAVDAVLLRALPEGVEPLVSRALRDLPGGGGICRHRGDGLGGGVLRPRLASAGCPRNDLLRRLPVASSRSWPCARGCAAASPIPALAIVLAVSVVVATLSWVAVERPIIRWSHRATRRPGGASPHRVQPWPRAGLATGLGQDNLDGRVDSDRLRVQAWLSEHHEAAAA